MWNFPTARTGPNIWDDRSIYVATTAHSRHSSRFTSSLTCADGSVISAGDKIDAYYFHVCVHFGENWNTGQHLMSSQEQLMVRTSRGDIITLAGPLLTANHGFRTFPLPSLDVPPHSIILGLGDLRCQVLIKTGAAKFDWKLAYDWTTSRCIIKTIAYHGLLHLFNEDGHEFVVDGVLNVQPRSGRAVFTCGGVRLASTLTHCYYLCCTRCPKQSSSPLSWVWLETKESGQSSRTCLVPNLLIRTQSEVIYHPVRVTPIGIR